MRVASGIAVKVRSVGAGLALRCCSRRDAARRKRRRPARRKARCPRPTAAGRCSRKPPAADQGGETNKIGSVDRDLNKDLASSPIQPGGPTTDNPPAGKAGASKPEDATKSGQP